MQLPPHLLRLLSAGAIAAATLTGCASEAEPAEGPDETPAPEQLVNEGAAAVTTKQVEAVADAAVEQPREPVKENIPAPTVSPRTDDPCPGCGMG